MSFRKEQKYRLSISDMALMQKDLFIEGMEQLYPSRIVNSCYFDNDTLTFFENSEEGVLPRKKVRIRWYNNILKFTKETKISSLEGRYKISEKIKDPKSINAIVKLDYLDQSFGKLNPTLIVIYERQYFSLKSLRLTFDRNISYKFNKFNFQTVCKDIECVLEVKTSNECEDDYIHNLIPHPSSRFSKYSRGILLCKNLL